MSDIDNRNTVESYEVGLGDLLTSSNPNIKVDFVKIPMIQRDYAQGRPDKKMVRERFLQALFDAIDREDAKLLMLDFVYGQRKSEKNKVGESTGKRTFEPIDGQQRLTTLYLLNLYVAKRIDNNDALKWLRRFSYETRQSSTRFCEKLIEMPKDAFSDLESYLKTQPWYTQRYRKDPTISGMVQTLTDIVDHYSDKSFDVDTLRGVWERLQQNIHFMLLYLKNLNTTDDLYIKMNSRGLRLTDFEQFKAELEGYFKDVPKTKEIDFGVKIDTTWTNLLWDYRKKSNDGISQDMSTYDREDKSPYTRNGLDRMFHHLFRRFMIIEGYKNDLFIKIKRENYKEIRTIQDYNDNPNADLLRIAEIVFKDASQEEKIYRMTRLCRFINRVYEASNKDGVCNRDLVGDYFAKFLYCGTYDIDFTTESQTVNKIRLFGGSAGFGTDLLNALCSEYGLDFGLTLIIEAFIEFCYSDVTEAEFRTRLRIVRNLIANSEPGKENMAKLLNRVDEIIRNGEEGMQIALADFNTFQKEQEKAKLDWIEAHQEVSPDLVNLLFRIENHDAIWGDLSMFIKKEKSLDDDSKPTYDFTAEYFDLFLQVFPDKGDTDWMLRHQAMMTIADYAKMDGRFALYASDLQPLWRSRVFGRNNEYVYPVVFKLLDDCLDAEDIEKKLASLRKAYLKSCEENHEMPWRYYVVKYKGIQRGDDRKVFKYDGREYEVVAFNKTSWNSRRWNPFLNRISKEPGMSAEFNLENYEDKLQLTKLQLRVWSSEHEYEIRPMNSDTPKFYFTIPYNEETGLDKTDRVELFLRFYKALCAAIESGKEEDIMALEDVGGYGIKARESDDSFADFILKKKSATVPNE